MYTCLVVGAAATGDHSYRIDVVLPGPRSELVSYSVVSARHCPTLFVWLRACGAARGPSDYLCGFVHARRCPTRVTICVKKRHQ
jgi:hypothetical protein